MSSYPRFILGVVIFIGLCAAGASAHHTGTMYDTKKPIAIEGTVKEFLWINPHSMLWVVVPPKDGKPEEVWQVEATSPGRLTAIGWKKTTFKPGDRVKVECFPLKSGATGGLFRRATFLDTGATVSAGY